MFLNFRFFSKKLKSRLFSYFISKFKIEYFKIYSILLKLVNDIIKIHLFFANIIYLKNIGIINALLFILFIFNIFNLQINALLKLIVYFYF
jgi:hypothetical protein